MRASVRRTLLRTILIAGTAVLVAVSGLGLAFGLAASGADAAPDQPRFEHLYVLPDVQSAGPPTPTPTPAPPTPTPTPAAYQGGAPTHEESTVTKSSVRIGNRADGLVWGPRQAVPARPQARAASPAGMEGWGNSWVHVQNLVDRPNTFDYRFEPVFGDPVLGSVQLSDRAAATLNLQLLPGVIQSFFAGQLSSREAGGVAVYLEWNAGGSTVYEAPEIAKSELILPLIARQVVSYSTTVYIANAQMDGGPDAENEIPMWVYDNESGNILVAPIESLRRGEIAVRNIGTQSTFQSLPTNARGGYVGALHFDPEGPIAVMAVGEDENGASTSAYRARPKSAASTTQVLPVVRSGVAGDTLIAIANATGRPAEVTITYRGSPALPAVAGESASQTLSLAPRGAAFVDLGRLARGASANLPGSPFLGSAVVESTEPILVVAQDHDGLGSEARAAGAYNAYGPDDMGTHFGVPRLAYSDARQSTLYIAGGDATVDYEVVFMDDQDTVVGRSSGRVAPYITVAVDPGDAGVTPRAGTLRALISASGATSVVVHEATVGAGRRVVDPALWTPFKMQGGEAPPTSPATNTPTNETPTPSETATPSETPVGVDETATPGPSPTPPDEVQVFLPLALNQDRF